MMCALISGCKLIDPAEEIPSYISISSVSLTTSGNEGSGSHAITDAWIYIDGELLGAYEIPCKVPVLAEGAHTVLVLPGIKQNGMSSLRAIYPFYKGWETTVDLTRGAIDTLTPAFTYFPGTTFHWNCEFSGIATNFDPDGEAVFPGLMTTVSAPEAFEGFSGRIDLDETEYFFHGESSAAFVLDFSKEIYLECDYRSTQPFIIGLRNNDIGPGSPIQCLIVYPSDAWNKIYVRLNDALSGFPQGAHYSVTFEMTNPAGQSSSTLWLDNLKLIN